MTDDNYTSRADPRVASTADERLSVLCTEYGVPPMAALGYPAPLPPSLFWPFPLAFLHCIERTYLRHYVCTYIQEGVRITARPYDLPLTAEMRPFGLLESPFHSVSETGFPCHFPSRSSLGSGLNPL